MPPIGFALGFEAIALSDSLHDPKGGVRKECQAPFRRQRFRSAHDWW